MPQFPNRCSGLGERRVSPEVVTDAPGALAVRAHNPATAVCDPPAKQGSSCPAGAVPIPRDPNPRRASAQTRYHVPYCAPLRRWLVDQLCFCCRPHAPPSTPILLRWQATLPSRLGCEGTSKRLSEPSEKVHAHPHTSTHHHRHSMPAASSARSPVMYWCVSCVTLCPYLAPRRVSRAPSVGPIYCASHPLATV